MNLPSPQLRGALKYLCLSLVIALVTYGVLRSHPGWITEFSLIFIPSYISLVANLFVTVSKLPRMTRMGLLLPVLVLHGCSTLLFWGNAVVHQVWYQAPYKGMHALLVGPCYYMGGVVIHVTLFGISCLLERLQSGSPAAAEGDAPPSNSLRLEIEGYGPGTKIVIGSRSLLLTSFYKYVCAVFIAIPAVYFVVISPGYQYAVLPCSMALLLNAFALVSPYPRLVRMGLLFPVLLAHGLGTLLLWVDLALGSGLPGHPFDQAHPLLFGPCFYMYGVAAHVAIFGVSILLENREIDPREEAWLTI